MDRDSIRPKRAASDCSEWKNGSSSWLGAWRSNRNPVVEHSCAPRCPWLPELLNNPLSNRGKNQFRHAVQMQLLQNIAAMRLDRMRTDTEHGSHFLVGLAVATQLKNR